MVLAYSQINNLSVMILVVFVVGVLSLLYYYYLIKFRKYKSLFEVPGPSGSFLLGNALDFRSSEGKLCVAYTY